MRVPRRDRIIRLVKAMGYTETQTRNRMYRKFSKDNKPHIWVGERGAMLMGDTVNTAIVMTSQLKELFKLYSV